MKFKIVSVKGNSVRVAVGMINFDARIEEIDGRIRVQIPKAVFIPNKEDYEDLVGVIVGIYQQTTSLGDSTSYGKFTER